jgi:hypothetical protein
MARLINILTVIISLTFTSTAFGRDNTFIKVGDSISSSSYFLKGFGCGDQSLDGYSNLYKTIVKFRQRDVPSNGDNFCKHENSFSRNSIATGSGMRSPWAIDSGSLEAELKAIHPEYALIMFGTNDARDNRTISEYRATMQAIIYLCKSYKAKPILYTLPPRYDDLSLNDTVNSYNNQIHILSRQNNLPLINYSKEMKQRSLINGGLQDDRLHPNVFHVIDYDGDGWVIAHNAANLTKNALHYGANLRNLLTLQMLRKLER